MQPVMPKVRSSKPLYYHNGYLFRGIKRLADGSELLYCDKRQTAIGCTAIAHRKNGKIIVSKLHNGHERQEELAHAKLVRHKIRKIAENSTVSPKELINSAREEYGENMHLCGSNVSLARMIRRARGELHTPKVEEPGCSKDAYVSDSTIVKEEAPSPEPDPFFEMESDFGSMTQSTVDMGEEPLPPSSDQSISIPSSSFLEIIQNMILDTVRQSHDEIIDEIRYDSAPTSSQPSHSDHDYSLNSAVTGFLKSLASCSTNSILKRRANTLVRKIEDNVIELDSGGVDAILEATLKTFGA